MKELIYSVYALLFNLSALLFKVKKNRVALVSMHNEGFNDALGSVFEQLKKEDKYDFVFISRQDLEIKLSNVPKVLSFFLIKSRKLATSKYIFLNDNFLPLSKLKLNKESLVIQLWHAEGVFKKFGFAVKQEEKVRQREKKANEKTDYVICSSKAVVPFYAEAFGVKENKVLPLGSARTDYFFKKGNEEKAKKRLWDIYPETKNKKLILYAPTFRDTEKENKEILSHLNIKALKASLKEQYAVLIKLHPQINTGVKNTEGAIDVTDFDDVRQLVLACDVLITDYSSICMDFSLLSKKTVFFPYDLEKYCADRNFYFDYASYVPGKIATSAEEIAQIIKEPFDRERNDKFKSFNFDFEDGNSAKRIVDFLKNNNS